MPRARPAKRGRGGKTGRPSTEVTEPQWKTIEAMARAMCTHQEIADYLGIGIRTLGANHLKERFDKVTRMAAAATRWKVRTRQMRAALKGQPVASIWWGKQHLGQTDRPEHPEERGRELEIVFGAEQRLLEVLERLAKSRSAE